VAGCYPNLWQSCNTDPQQIPSENKGGNEMKEQSNQRSKGFYHFSVKGHILKTEDKVI
jgi:hypothetical protein